jgi:hypothetical protein
MSNEHNIVKNQSAELQSGAAFYTKIGDPIQAIQVMGEMIAGSGMFGCTKVEQGMVLAMQCLAEGKAPLELAKTYHILDGKLTMRSDAMLGRYLTSGGKVKWLVRNDTEVKGLWICDENEIEIGVKLEDMKANGVAMGKTGIKENWKKYPKQMLTARCISEAVRLLMPQIISGVYTPEEVQDFTSNDKPLPVTRVQAPQVAVSQVEVVEDAPQALANRLDAVLKRFEPKASEYLVSKGFIKDGQTYQNLDAMTAQRILANPSKIVTILEGSV